MNSEEGLWYMNFIDEALQNCKTGEEFVQAMADIYSNSYVRNELNYYPKWIKDIIVIIDYDTSLQMGGLDLKTYEVEIEAMKNMGLFQEAKALEKINEQSSNKDLEECYDNLALNNDYESFWNQVYFYAEKNIK